MTTSQIINYPTKTIDRADLALRCAPFNLTLLVTMKGGAVGLSEIIGDGGVTRGYSRQNLSELAADSYLQWLMQVGILRREVDGQGLTDRFRLTPLGLQLTEKWESTNNTIPTPGLFDRLRNFIGRWLRWPL
jgi:predicted transcriptional regulator